MMARLREATSQVARATMDVRQLGHSEKKYDHYQFGAKYGRLQQRLCVVYYELQDFASSQKSDGDGGIVKLHSSLSAADYLLTAVDPAVRYVRDYMVLTNVHRLLYSASRNIHLARNSLRHSKQAKVKDNAANRSNKQTKVKDTDAPMKVVATS